MAEKRISEEMLVCLKRYWGYTQFRPYPALWVMRQSTGEISIVSLRATEGSEAISTEITSSPAAPRNDRLLIPPFTDRLPLWRGFT